MTSPSPATPSPAPLSADGVARLSTALDLEHQAVYAYGVLGPYLNGSLRTSARTAEATHRTRRDKVEALLGDAAPTAAAGYALPQPVKDKASALALAVVVEDGVTTAYRAALAVTSGGNRKIVLDAMIDAANRAAAWRRAAGTTPGTVSFPGRPA
ncbi:MAG: ferritin-like domain-containing protein [Hamadaea sp.]|nr:ferritin-like domain-containing protein [Hamadaea sp.]NUR49826.1 ferritin-like domain-containing protein [Hamadaea sp.]NUT06566.1 ferritin-like domain-containing protein [Hamadaea sp.]